MFLRLYRSRQTYRPRARFSTWVFHITQNVAPQRDALAPPPPLRPAGLRGAVGPAACWRGCSSTAAGRRRGRLERDELAGVVRAAVAGLAERQRAAVELHQFDERTYAEVAAELDMTPKAAKSLLYRARSQLREVLQPLVQ